MRNGNHTSDRLTDLKSRKSYWAVLVMIVIGNLFFLEINATANPLEKTKKNMETLLNVGEQNQNPLLTANKIIFENLAKACPFIEGPAVHWARGILFSFNGLSYINDCEFYEVQNLFANRMKATSQQTKEIKVFPNPAKDDFKVDIELEKNEISNIIIYDLTGKLISSSRLKSGSNSIEISQIKPSIYFYQIIVNGKVKKTSKLVIQ